MNINLILTLKNKLGTVRKKLDVNEYDRLSNCTLWLD